MMRHNLHHALCVSEQTDARKRKNVWLVANNSRFLFRHFRPVINAAHDCGLKTDAVLPRTEPLTNVPEDVEIQYAPISRYLGFTQYAIQSTWMTHRALSARPAAIVAFSIRTALTLLPVLLLRNSKLVIYVTGLGLLALADDWRSRFMRDLSFAFLRAVSRHPNCYFVFENSSDPLMIGLSESGRDRRMTVDGAGVDPIEFAAEEFPPSNPFKLAVVSRIIWSKGVDLAAEAASELGKEGFFVELSIYGEEDPANPRSVDLRKWANDPYVKFRGYTADIPRVWANHHAGLFPSRGGEGIPRALLEAAACGRPCVVTDVAGCAEFIRNGVEGYVAKSGSVESLKEAIRMLLQNQGKLQTMGTAARNRVLELSSREIIEGKFRQLFTDLIGSEPEKSASTEAT